MNKTINRFSYIVLLYFLLSTFILSYITFFVGGCDEDVNWGNPSSGNDERKQIFAPNLDLVYGYTPGSNQYRPLGNNPFPNGLQVVWDAYTGVNFNNKFLFVRNLNLLNDEALNELNYDTYRFFYTDYKTKNNITFDEDTCIHVFGITRIKNLGIDIWGTTFAYKTLEYEVNNHFFAPSLCFILTGNIDSSLKARNYNDEQRKKAITYVTVHEITHGRGLNDLSDSCNVHYCHNDTVAINLLYCDMNNLNASYLSYIYPPFFCSLHKNYIRDSLSSKIIEGLYLKRNP